MVRQVYIGHSKHLLLHLPFLPSFHGSAWFFCVKPSVAHFQLVWCGWSWLYPSLLPMSRWHKLGWCLSSLEFWLTVSGKRCASSTGVAKMLVPAWEGSHCRGRQRPEWGWGEKEKESFLMLSLEYLDPAAHEVQNYLWSLQLKEQKRNPF